jgi:hypothetical protein
MRLLLWCAIAYERLPKGTNHPAWRLYGGPIAASIKHLLTWLTGLPWAEYEPHRKEVAERLAYHATTIDWLTKHDGVRAETPAAVKSRRARLRKRGHRFPKRDSWHFGPVGSMLANHPDGLHYAQLTITGATFRWRLEARDREEAEAIIEPARSARAQVRKAVEEWGACELRTPASLAAETRVVTACGIFATELSAVGAPEQCIRFAMKPPMEVGTSSLLPVAASRKAIKKAAVENCVARYIELIEAYPNGPPEPREVLARKMMKDFRVTWHEARDCRGEAIKRTGNLHWSRHGRPRR